MGGSSGPRALSLLLVAAASLAACQAMSSAAPSPSATLGGTGTATIGPSQATGPAGSPSGPTLPSATVAAPSGPAPAVQVLRLTAVPAALAVASPRDGSGRLFVAGQGGQVWIVSGGQRSGTPVLDIAGRITSGGERGLLGIAFHPRFPADPRLFVDYTDSAGNTVVSSFRVTGDTADPRSEQVVLRQPQPYSNHNGGAIVFGPDGRLDVALGDGGSAGDPQGNGQRLDTLLGKILRIDVDAPGGGLAYGIPDGNPFAGRAGARPEIWLTGLRNPWRFSFDRATGDLWIGDVGQNLWEEVDVARAGTGGLNFGWNRTEGFHCYAPAQGCDTSGLTEPVAEYGHGPRCSITGGFVYRGAAYPALQGRYLFGDYCTGELMTIVAAGSGRREVQVVGRSATGLSGFGEDDAGEPYVTNVVEGWVGRLAVAVP